MPAMKLSDDGSRLIVRLFEPTGSARRTTLRIPALDVALDLRLSPFEVRTLSVDLATKAVFETDLLEQEKR